MAARREKVNLSFDADQFTGRLALIEEAARRANAEWALRTATWEPHDWSAF